MKKIFLIITLSLFGITSYGQGTGFHAGAELGTTIGEANDFFGFTFSLEFNYLWQVSNKTSAGISVGYNQFFDRSPINLFGGSQRVNSSFISPAVAGRYSLGDKFFFGADVGYGIGISPSENEGGFYYRPMLGYNFSDRQQWTLSYRGITKDNFTFSSLTIGDTYSF